MFLNFMKLVFLICTFECK